MKSGDVPAQPVFVTHAAAESLGIPRALYMGLTKRELFAAMAMQGVNACSEFADARVEIIAKYAVEQADALLAALEKQP
ncbi:hypothetical protein EA660_18170 [Pseudoxanthomonas winnipegensis]|uniref:Uncharacterized protein n=2 Tax=Pseudoxanthomonas winnipegensis TaxID=2480810 RepID=A0A4Q8L5A9_9GAMM|nr:hypothetical protein EA660_18170 [Pseudoxanthomonas winnipegensis]